ncbi:MAG TPA: hypothetical protein VFO55_04325 [Gemmatimonadaceae bacterium]|nr:hypothetical protein [Gemmatimonadaceae bacterium]
MTRLLKLVVTGAVVLAACSEPEPAPSPPKAVRPVTPTTQTGIAGTAVQGGITVHVVDYSDRDVVGAKVGFSVLAGDGSVSERLVITDESGLAHTEWTLGQTAGENEVTASIFGVDSTAHFVATGTPGPAAAVSIVPKTLRIPASSTTGTLSGTVVDQYGNPIAGAATYTSRNTGVVTVSGTGTVTASSRGASTYVIVSAGGFTDSSLVVVMTTTDPPCTGISAMAQLAVGDVMVSGFSDNGICVPSGPTEREYAIVPFFDSPVPSAQTVFGISGVGVKTTAVQSLGALRPRDERLSASTIAAEANAISLDRRLRIAERREMPMRTATARRWYSERMATTTRRANRAVVVPSVGDQMQLNVNANDFCSSPSMRTGRVAAVTAKAVVVADVSNPEGLTDADYASLGMTFDTLVYAVDVANFGAPTDIDSNGGRVVLFFTHAVNELGPGTLGFAYSRDLLPKSGPLGSCPGSNVAELLNLYVPDATTSVNDVKANAVATMAHELQHVINSARRLYINANAAPVEERWLNEGLSHIAEELLFYRSTNLAPRQNLGFQVLTAAYQSAFVNYQRQNFNRYFRFTKLPDVQGPVGINDDDDDIETRGAVWSFLRFAADQRFGGNEAAFWQSLVDANSTGLTNLYEHVGADTRKLMRDWTLSVYLDDLVATEAKYAQLSWNIRQVPGFSTPITFQLASQNVPSNPLKTITLRALSSAFVRFAVGADQEAYVSASGLNGTALPRNVLLAIVRTK